MFIGLQQDQLKGALEALLFVTDEPVNTITLADMLEVEPAEVEAGLVDLRAQLEEENRGIVVREVAGGWRIYTHPAYHELIEKYVLSWDTRKLSQAALETLSIIAYSQPLTRAGVASVRGVNSDSSINSLVEKGLVREAGTENAPGNPVLYATTRTFLEKFGLRSVDDLPDLESYAPDDETRAFIRARLSATRIDADGVAPEGEQGEEELFVFDKETSSRKEEQASLYPEACPDADDDADTVDETLRRAMTDALARSAGAVEKIDFNELNFED
ncbi:MAG: SMC-Scp complex subunit ScpB [Raoultibacter sp.]